MVTFNLSKEGYVLNYLTTGAVTAPFVAPFAEKNQLKFEAEMRHLYNKEYKGVAYSGMLGEKSALGTPWQFYAQNRNPYIDFSEFYFTLTDIKIHAFTCLVSDKAKKVRARIYSYTRVHLAVNGEFAASIAEPVYKPINHVDFEMDLKEGVNEIFIDIENFGVRDTRNLFLMQIVDKDGIAVTLPGDENALTDLKAAEDWLYAIRANSKCLMAECAPAFPVTVFVDGKETPWGNGAEFNISGGRMITVTFEKCGQKFERKFDIVQNLKVETREGSTYKERLTESLEKAAARVGTDHYSIYSALAHYAAAGELSDTDYAKINGAIGEVRKRIDCADFALSALLLAFKKLPLTDEVKQKIKDASLDFRFWMDQEGADGMCFWSENHALLFFTCQMIAGKFWPDEYFHRADMNGKEMEKDGRRKVCEWFDIIEHEGFEEFLSSGYMPVTIAVLLILYILCEDEIKLRAKGVIDRVVRECCIQCFDKYHLSPQGRVYRGTLTPFHSGLQALAALMDGDVYQCSTFWYALFAYADYEFPADAKELMYKNTEITFTSGRAQVTTKKTDGYMLTSVASPRRDKIEECPYKDTQYYDVLLMNEWFHGTTNFVPGQYGYQQHMWYAAIKNRCYTFVTHPGSECDLGDGEMRPDYWYGNGVFPAVHQENSTIYTYYEIPDDHPTKFTHAFWPTYAMEEERVEDGIRFARNGDSYMALWCSRKMELVDFDAIPDCDFRAYGDTCAWVVRVGTESEFGSFENFIKEFKALGLSETAVKDKILKF